MFHIFYVNRGYMLVLEPPALGSVYDLQKCISDSTGVGLHDQFLFLSGGISMSCNTMLSSIPDVGTDTNPVFLVRRVTNVQSEPVKVNANGIKDLYQGWELCVDRLASLPSVSSSAAINECIELGKKCANVAETIVRFCANIISEHQYLHQGWMAVIANLDDNINRILRRLDKSVGQAEKLETIRQKAHGLLEGFDKVLEVLQRIVIPSTLLSPINSSIVAIPSNDLSDSEGDEITLYDWISSKDPAYSLNSLSQHLLDHLQKVDDGDLKEAQAVLAMVQDVAQKSQYRDIGGIDKRLATLNSNLQKLEESLSEMREAIKAVVHPIIQDSTQNVVVWQKKKLYELKDKLKNQHDCAFGFINSKDELVRNICQRLATWIRQAYQRLYDVNKRVMCFEEKFTGLHQRLNLTRQIREAPSIYMAAVPEVMRRELLKRELSTLLDDHIKKASTFISEENKIRQEFYVKLDRHFLRQLFTGMNTLIPQFTSSTPPKIDETLPKVPISHLHELRKTFPDMKELLSVGAPRVFSRLAIMDPNSPNITESRISPTSMGGGALRREESFYVRHKSSNMEAMNQNFPSTNWLSEEAIGFSPACEGANFITMGRAFATSTSSTSLRSLSGMVLQSPQELGPLNEQQFNLASQTTSSASTIIPEANRGSMSPIEPSAPITIPSNTQTNETDPIESIGSNHFSTPEDTFASFGSNSGSRFVNVRQNLPMHHSMLHSSPKISRPSSILREKDAPFHSQTIKEDQDQQIIETDHHQFAITYNNDVILKLANTQKELHELSTDLSYLRQSNDELRTFAISLCDVSEIKHQIETYIQTKCDAIVKLQQPLIEERHAQEIVQIEQRKQDEIEKLKNELEQQRKLVGEKENELSGQKEIVSRLNDEVAALSQERDELLKQREETITASIDLAKDTDESAAMVASTSPTRDAAAHELTLQSPTEMAEPQKEEPDPIKALVLLQGSDEDDGVAKLTNSRSCGTQTKIRVKDMRTFVSLNEVYECCGALIIWNPNYNAYVARSTVSPNSPYIVKDSSFDKLGVRRPPRPVQQASTDASNPTTSTSATAPRPWMFVYVESIELCQIRKPTNRYNLPLDTRFYRISVVPMPGEFVNAASMSSTSSVTSSKR